MQHLMKAYNEFLESNMPGEQVHVIHNGEEKDFSWLLDQLRECQVQIPAYYCAIGKLPHGCTYAQAVYLLEEGARILFEEAMEQLKDKFWVDEEGIIRERKLEE